jgi:hypothetical protein
MAQVGYFVSRWKGRLCLPPENSRAQPLPGRIVRGPIALSKAVVRSSSTDERIRVGMMSGSHRLSRCRLRCPSHEAGDVLRGELDPDIGPEHINAELPEILVEVPEGGRERDRLDPDRVRPFD